MRLVICLLACVSAGGMSLALADPPADSAAAPAAAPAATAPAASPAPAASSTPAAAAQSAKPAADEAKPAAVTIRSTPEEDALEKHFLAEGYKLEMHNGEKYFCRREEALGSRLGGQKVCGTAQQLDATEREAKSAYQRSQSQQTNPKGN